ncbi:hypothetical protein P7D29_05505 [Lactococcus petauri]|nr:hypothetical protein [Lactococcus petauri]MDT2594366.1 hypothetical protein [Lactococcus petauri]
MTVDKFLIFLLLGSLIAKDAVNKEWTVWMWVAVFVLQVLAVISKYL